LFWDNRRRPVGPLSREAEVIREICRTVLIQLKIVEIIYSSFEKPAVLPEWWQTALDRFDDRIRRVDVHLSDAVGDKAGHDDKCCMIEARCDGREPIIVTHQESTMDQGSMAPFTT
jgi:hypothetical protein